jgi:DNA-binding transcriptional LysR family regulator
METFAGMRLFAEVVDSGSFSAAGRRLGLAASSVARAIGTLENQLGVRLLNRTTRKLGLTEAGRLYHERTKRILAEVEEARLSVTQLETAPRGTLRLSVPVSFGRLHIAPALPGFLALHPALRVDLATTDAFVDLVEEGVDLAIRIGELEDSSLIARRLAPNRRVICASPGYLERHGVPAAPEALSGHNCLIYKRRENRSLWRLRDAERIHEIEVRGSLLANNADALHVAALAGLGLTILPVWLVGPDIQRGALSIVLADHQVSAAALDSNIYAVFPHSRHLSAKVRAFVDFLRQRFGPRPYWEVDDQQGSATPHLEAAAS